MPLMEDESMLTIENTVKGKIAAMGPCTFSELVHEARTQATEPDADNPYLCRLAVVAAINTLMKSGTIELYDTGDSYDLA